MDNSDLTPPKPQSLSDEALELALEEAKKQGDGMIAAMVLLEQEAQLREEDEREFSAWVEKLTNDPRPEAKAALAQAVGAPSEVHPIDADIVEIPSLVDQVQTENPETLETEPAFKAEDDAATDIQPIQPEPEPIPAPVSQEAAFDELLAIGSDAATDAISTLPDDFSVTSVVEQIVEKVKTDFSASADEDATALEESAHTPVSAFEAEIPKPTKVAGRNKTAFAVFWNQLGLFGVAVPLLVAVWAASSTVSLSSVLVGSFSGLILVFGLNLIALRSASRATKTHSLISRATFGVFGNILPTTLNTISRLVVLALVTVTATSIFNLTINGAIAFDTEAFSGFSYSGLISCGCIALALLVASIRKLRKYLPRVALGSAMLWMLVSTAATGVASINFGSIDLGAALLLALVILALGITTVGFGFSSAETTGSDLWSPRVQLASFLATVIVPVSAIFLLTVSVLSTVIARIRFDETALQTFVFVSPAWLATATIWILAAVALTLIVSTFDWASESLQALFLNRVWLRNCIVAVTGLSLVGIGEVVDGWVTMAASALLLVLLAPAIWAGAYLTQSLMRQSDYHDVSLMRSYAFYKPASVFALIGYLGIFTFAIGITEVSGLAWTGFLARYLDSALIFGNYSGVILGFIAASIWTLVTSLPRVRNQEREVAAVDERRSEIAGVELPE